MEWEVDLVMLGGRVFQREGIAHEKAFSPGVLVLLGTVR